MSWEGSGDTTRFCEFDSFFLSVFGTDPLSCRLDVRNVGGAIRGFLS